MSECFNLILVLRRCRYTNIVFSGNHGFICMIKIELMGYGLVWEWSPLVGWGGCHVMQSSQLLHHLRACLVQVVEYNLHNTNTHDYCTLLKRNTFIDEDDAIHHPSRLPGAYPLPCPALPATTLMHIWTTALLSYSE